MHKPKIQQAMWKKPNSKDYTMWFSLHEFLENAKLEGQKTNQWLPEAAEGLT